MQLNHGSRSVFGHIERHFAVLLEKPGQGTKARDDANVLFCLVITSLQLTMIGARVLFLRSPSFGYRSLAGTESLWLSVVPSSSGKYNKAAPFCLSF